MLLWSAGFSVAAANPAADRYEFEVGSISAGERRDNMRWSIAGPGFDPDIISELTWREVRIRELSLQGLMRFRWVSINASYQQGEVYDGQGQDSDYGGDNRSREFSRSYNDTKGDVTRDISLGGGLHIPVLQAHRWQFTPQAGYSHHEQKWRMTNGRQAVSVAANMPEGVEGSPPPLGSFRGLNSSYRARWSGIWYGGTGRLRLSRFALTAAYHLHIVEYYGYANWNLIRTFEHPKSYEQRANGLGHVLSLGGSVDVAFLRFFIRYDQQYWETGEGYTRFFLASGERPTQPLNSVQWRSHALHLGMLMHF